MADETQDPVLQPLPVKGYSPQHASSVSKSNRIKEIEERVMRELDELAADPECDGRAIAVARTNLQTGFMWAVRGIFKPTRIILPEDKTSGGAGTST